MLLKIADFYISFNNKYRAMLGDLEPFIVNEDKKPDFEISVSKEEVKNAEDLNELGMVGGRIEGFLLQKKFAEMIPFYDAFAFHAATFSVDGVGVAFTALSGVGKTTHMLNWQRYLGDRLKIINGDKPFIRFFPENPNVPIAYGAPWCGKEHFGTAESVPLKHLCFIERGDKTEVRKGDKEYLIEKLLPQTFLPNSHEGLYKTMELMDRLLSSCKLWIITCTKDPSSAEIAYNEIFKGEKHEA